jgi:hypothetical protein
MPPEMNTQRDVEVVTVAAVSGAHVSDFATPGKHGVNHPSY